MNLAPDRSSRILAALVRQYIECGEPVSSLWLAQNGGFGLSSATVRNVLVSLEELGYIYQPHKSAGRVPTDRGYRSYVDTLLNDRQATHSSPDVEARLRQAGTVSDVLSNVSPELSLVSHHLGFAMIPPTTGTLKQIEFIRLEGTKILVVVETDTAVVEQKVVDLGETVRPSELQQGSNYLNAEFSGLPLWSVRAAVSEQLRQERMFYDQLLSRALRVASSTLEGMVSFDRLFIEGTGFLLEEIAEDEGNPRVPVSALRALLSIIERKDQLLRLLNAYIDGDGLTVVIGAEHASPELRDLSLVMSTCGTGDRTGSVGVIGPRRMKYSRAISAVDSLSISLGRVLVTQDTLSSGKEPVRHHDRRPHS